MSIYIKNTDTIDHTWSGQVVTPSSYYLIEDGEKTKWQADSQLLTDIGNSIAIVAKDDSGSTDITDVNLAINYLKENIEQEFDKQNMPIIRTKGMYIDSELSFMGRGFSGTAANSTTSNIDYTLTADAHIDSVDIFLKDQAWADYMKFQIVHPQAGVVGQFSPKWHVNSQREYQPHIDPPQISDVVPAGMIIRIEYTSTGTTDVKVKCNLHLQEYV